MAPSRLVRIGQRLDLLNRAYAGQQRYRDCLMRLLNLINVFGEEY